MPHSPFIQQIEAPVSEHDFAVFRYDIQRIRWERDEGADDRFALDTTLHSGELLIEQCEFLEAKLTFKKRENFQLTTHSEALTDKVATLEMECRVMRDENRVYKEELAAVKAKLDMETKEKEKVYKEKLVAALFAKLEMEKLRSALQQCYDKATEPAEAAEPAEPAEAADGKYGRYQYVATLDADPLKPPPLKREAGSNPTSNQQPPRKVRRVVASVEGRGEEDATYIG